MYCPECGHKVRGNIAYCPECGAPIGAVMPAVNNASEKDGIARRMLSSKLFLSICIVLTLASITSFSDISKIDIFSSLLTVGMWLIYIGAKSKKNMPRRGFTFCAMLLRVTYIICWVAFAVLAALAVLATVASVLTMRHTNEVGDIVDGIYSWCRENIPEASKSIVEMLHEVKIEFGITTEEGVFRLIFVVSSVLLYIAAGLLLVMNLCFFRYFDRYTHDLLRGYDNGSLRVHDRAVGVRFLFIAVISGLGKLSIIDFHHPMYIASYILSFAFLIMMFILVGERRTEERYYAENIADDTTDIEE